MKSSSWVVLLSSLVCLPAAGFAGDPPTEELMTEVPETGPETRLGITEEELLVSDVAVFPADPGEEDPEIALTYWAARDHIAQGNWSHARSLLEEGLEKFPQSRHLHQQLAELLWFEYNDVSREPETLAAAASHAVRAERLAMGAGRSDPALHELAARLLGRRGDVAAIDEVFAAVVEMDDSAASHASYAEALALAGDDRAASMYRAASERAPGDLELRIRLAEWHLLRGQLRRGLAELNRRPRVDVPYSWFLRGYANEKMGRSRRALDRYQRFMPANEAYPVPDEFRIGGSKLQQRLGVRFRTAPPVTDGEGGTVGPGPQSLSAAVTTSQAISGLSYLVYGEARGETVGGMRAAGWIVRNRVLRGSVPSSSGSCPAVSNGGSTLADRYASVMCQSSQFVGMCLAWCSNPSTTSCSNNSTTSAVASDIYNGHAPDPVGGHCPGGFQTSAGFCSSTTRCLGRTDTFRLAGAVFNIGAKTYTDACNSHFCAPTNQGKVCGNSGTAGSGYDNCFYSNTQYAPSGKGQNYTGSISATGACQSSGSFTASAGTHKGHLEGAESTSNPDLDLYLQILNGTTYSDVAYSTRGSSVEDIAYSGASGTYRWQVCSYSGAAGYSLYTQRP